MRTDTSPSHKETRVCERGLLSIIFKELKKMKDVQEKIESKTDKDRNRP